MYPLVTVELLDNSEVMVLVVVIVMIVMVLVVDW